MQHSARPFFNGWQHLRRWCLYLSSLLKTIKINGGVECRWCMKNSRFSTQIWSISTWSPFGRSVIAYCAWADDHVGAVNYIHWSMAQPPISHDQWTMYDASHRSYVEDKLSKTISDSIFRDPWWYRQSAPTTEYDKALSCKFSHRSARDICPQPKSRPTYCPYRGLPWELPNHAIHFRKLSSSWFWALIDT